MNRYEDLTVIEHDKARNDEVQGGYKYLIRGKAFTAYTAYKTDKGFNDWLKRSNLALKHIETNSIRQAAETKTAKVYKAYGVIENYSFWNMEQVPEMAMSFTGLSNGSLVDC